MYIFYDVVSQNKCNYEASEMDKISRRLVEIKAAAEQKTNEAIRKIKDASSSKMLFQESEYK